MLLLVGLGNPGAKYAHNRHNIGFMAVDEIVRRHDFGPWRSKFDAEIAEGRMGGEKVLAMKPQTYMNESGRAVGKAVQFFKIPIHKIVVIHDELDLAPGKVRMKTGGGHAGHNGLRSIDAHAGNAYRRVRIGIGHPGRKELVTHWVLGDFAKADADWLDPLLDAVAGAAPHLAQGEDSRFQSEVARNAAPPTPDKPAPDKPASGAPAAKPAASAPEAAKTDKPGGPFAALTRLIRRED